LVKEDLSRDIEIHISTSTVVKTLFVVALAAVAWFLRDILLIVLTSVVLAAAIEPPARFFMKRRMPRVLALVLVYLIGGTLLIGTTYLVVPAFLSDIKKMSELLPELVSALSIWNPLEGGSFATSIIQNSVQSGGVVATQGAPIGEALAAFETGIQQGGALQTLSVFFGGLLSFVLIIVLSFYFAAQERGIENFLRLISPMRSRSYVVDLWHRSQEKIGLWFQGQLLLGLLVGVLTFIGLTLLGVQSALLLAALAAVFELIPVFGPVLSAVPAVVIAFSNGLNFTGPGLTAGLIVVLFYFIIQQFENHLFYPLVVRKVTGLPPVLVILSLVIGAKVAGFIGIILAVPLTAVLMEYLSDIAKERRVFDDEALVG
jgi:predicted PurR-regulated permease PerM